MIPKNELLEKDKNWDVYVFCKKNKIDCSWDFDRKSQWTEIFMEGSMLFQFESTTTEKQFVKTIQLLHQNFTNNKDIENIDGNVFWVAIGEKSTFDKFIKKYSDVFKICL